MNSYKPYNPQSYRKTYELETFPYIKEYTPYNSTLNNKINSQRIFNSPPIILCETGKSKGMNSHTHHYLFYPSKSRLSPFSKNSPSFNNIKNINSRKNKYNQERSLTNRINDDSKNDILQYNEFGDQDSKNNFKRRINHRAESMDNIRNEEKYLEMFDKSLQLIKTISDFMPEEEAKIKGDSSYYYNRNRDYDNIIEKQKNFLKKYFKSNNENKTGEDINSNNNDNYYNNSQSDINGNYRQFQNINTLDKINNAEIEMDSRKNIINKGNNNFNPNNNENEDNDNIINSGSTFNKDNNFSENSGNKIMNKNSDSQNYFDNQEINHNNKIWNRTTNDNLNFGTGGRNINNNQEYSTFPNNSNNMNLNINFKDTDNNKNIRNYINDYNNSMNYKTKNKNQMKPKTLIKMEQNNENNNYYKGNSGNNNLSNTVNNERNNGKNIGNNNFNSNNNKINQNLNSGMSDLSTKDYLNINNPFRNNIENNINKNNPFSESNFSQKFNPSKGNSNIYFQSIPDNDNEKQFYSSINKNTNTLKNESNININGENNDFENNQIKDITAIKSSKNMALFDENNQKILSNEGEPFLGERINNKYEKDNKVFVVTKTGDIIKSSLLQGKEGEPIFVGNKPLLGKDKKFFYDKGGIPVVYPDEKYMEGEPRIQVQIKELKNSINNTGDLSNSQNYYNIGVGGSDNNELKKSRFVKNKNKNKFFPKGDGNAKPPIKKKKRFKKNKKMKFK